MSERNKEKAVRTYYQVLYSAWGCQNWWPAHSRFEMIVGAYLTQNTSWTNVEKALSNLRRATLLTIDGIRRTPRSGLEKLIRPSGYFRQKTQRLKLFVNFLDDRYGGSLSRMFARPTSELRSELLALDGVGPETADSILLYAGNHDVFVVDAYTKRVLERHEIIDSSTSYEEIRSLCERALEANVMREAAPVSGQTEKSMVDSGRRGSCHVPSRVSRAKRSEQAQIFNEMHGLIVGVGKNYCLKSQPRCEECPLQPYLPASR